MWTTKIVGAMWDTQKNPMLKQSRIYNPESIIVFRLYNSDYTRPFWTVVKSKNVFVHVF